MKRLHLNENEKYNDFTIFSAFCLYTKFKALNGCWYNEQ